MALPLPVPLSNVGLPGLQCVNARDGDRIRRDDGAEAMEECVMAMLATHDAPLLPHDLTWRICAPTAPVTWALTDVPFTIVVLLLLSNE